jgi:WS/DGAT/MGAT family acyltransferase
MAEQLQRVSALDWQFLSIEDRSATHMHIGSAMIFAGPAPEPAALRDFVDSRIHLAPRFQQQLLAHPIPGAGKPSWVDDPAFDVANHVVAAALPAPGGQAELNDLIGEVFSTRLDRDRPLWRIWFVTGLQEDRWALVSKMHHTMVDGLGALDLFAALLDFGPTPREVAPPTAQPRPEPGRLDVLRAQLQRNLATAKDFAENVKSMVANPGEAGPRLVDIAKGLVDTAEAALPLPPATPLNVATGPYRGYDCATFPLSDFKEIRRALGGTVNDAVLAVTGDAVGRYLRERGVDTAGMELRAQIPSAIRSEATAGGAEGNVFVVLVVQLPVDQMAAGERHAIVEDRMKAMKESGVGTGVAAVLGATNFLAPTILAQTTRLFFSKILFSLLVSNVPGVQFPVYMMGSQLLTLAPLPWVGPQQALNVAVMSYHGQMTFGIMVDREAVTDVDRFIAHLTDAQAALLSSARAGSPA